MCPGLIILAASLDLAENYQRTKPWLSLADFATRDSHHDCIWQRLFPSHCPFSVALSQTWGEGSDLWGMLLPGPCPGEQPTCSLLHPVWRYWEKRVICAVPSEPHILSYTQMKAIGWMLYKAYFFSSGKEVLTKHDPLSCFLICDEISEFCWLWAGKQFPIPGDGNCCLSCAGFRCEFHAFQWPLFI